MSTYKIIFADKSSKKITLDCTLEEAVYVAKWEGKHIIKAVKVK